MSRELKLQVVLAAIDKATAPIRGIMQGTAGLGQQLRQTRDELRQLEKTQGLVQNFTQLKEATAQSGAAFSAQQQKVKELAIRLRDTESPSKTLTREFDTAVRVAGRMKQAHQDNQQELQGLRNKLSEAGVNTKNLSQDERNLRDRIAETNAAMQQQRERLDAAAASQKRLNDARRQFEQTQQLAANLTTAGAGAIATGAGAIYGGVRMLQVGVEFDASMSKVQALARLDKDSAEMKALREQARQLGADTMFSASEAASGMGFLAMAGFDPQQIRDAMPGMLDLAKAGDLDLGAAADIASNILSGMGLEAAQMGSVGDVLVGAFTRSNTSLEMIGETMKHVAPVAAGLNQEIEIVAAATGKLGDAGIQGGRAGTALRSIMSRLAAPPTAALKALEQLDIQTKDAAGNMLALPDILEDLYKKTEKLGTAERAAALKAIAGEQSVSALQILVDQAGGGELQAFIAELKDASGEASQVSAVMADNLAGDWMELNSIYEDVKLSLFSGQNEHMRELVRTATSAVRAVGGWIKENPKLVATLVKVGVVIAALIAAGGALMVMIGSILGPFAMLRYGLTVLGVKGGVVVPVLKSLFGVLVAGGKALLANPIILAVALLAGAAFLIYKNWDGIVGGLAILWQQMGDAATAAIERLKAFFSPAWEEIKAAFGGGIAGIGALILNWSPLGLFYQAFAGVLSWFGVELPGKFTEFGQQLISGLIKGIKDMAGMAKDAIAGVGENVTNWFKDKLGIRSPSRVFQALGADTVEGLNVGLASNGNRAVRQISQISAQIVAAGAITLSGAAVADGLQFDTRPSIAPSALVAPAAAPVQHSTIEINVYAAPGMDEAQLAAAVRRELEAAQRNEAVRRRSTFGDLD